MEDNIDGFSLLELIVVLVVVGILAIYPFLQWTGSAINLDAQAENVANDIRYAQSLSMTKGQRYQFTFTSSTTYQITSTSGTAVLLSNGGTTATLNSGITFGTLVNLPNNLIAFDGTGAPYIDTSATPTALASNASIPLTASGATKTIVVQAETGSVSIQ